MRPKERTGRLGKNCAVRKGNRHMFSDPYSSHKASARENSGNQIKYEVKLGWTS